MTKTKMICAHESTVVAFGVTNQNVELKLDDALVDGMKTALEIKMTRVCNLIVDGVELDFQSERSLMASDDGEIVSIDINDNEIYVIIEWHEFSERKIFTKSYRIIGELVLN